MANPIGFQQLAATRLLLWEARALYLGPGLDLSAHRNAVAVYALALSEPFTLLADPLDETSEAIAHESALISPGTLHRLRAPGPMGFLYLDALGEDLAFLSAMDPQARDETFRPVFVALLLNASSRAQAREAIGACLGRVDPAPRDARIAQAIRALRDDPTADHRLGAMARRADLSPSRFLHLFKAATGVPLRRYRVWTRMGTAMRALNRGANLTEAALTAGFASSAHFSTAFRGMFGLTPSDLTARLRA